MARFYFDIIDGTHSSFDDEGHELPDFEAAQREARKESALLIDGLTEPTTNWQKIKRFLRWRSRKNGGRPDE